MNSSRTSSPRKKPSTPKQSTPVSSPRKQAAPRPQKLVIDRESLTAAGIALLFVTYFLYNWVLCPGSRSANTSPDSDMAHDQGEENAAQLSSSVHNYVLAALVLALCIAIKRVMDKKSRDYRPSYGVGQISAKEFKQQAKNLTAQELYKL